MMDDSDDDWDIGIPTFSSSFSKAASRQPPPPPPFSGIHGGHDLKFVEDEDDDDDDHDHDYFDEEDVGDDEDDGKLGCPFCLEDFDVLGLCCHIDVAHHRENKAAMCPVCVTMVETNMAAHLISQHETILKILGKKKIHKGGSRSALSLFKKKLQDERPQSPLERSSSVNSLSNGEVDSLLLSFVYNPQSSQKPEMTSSASEASLLRSNSCHNSTEGDVKVSALPDKDQEQAQRCEFLHGLLFSTIFYDEC